jgi:hypothetical protein
MPFLLDIDRNYSGGTKMVFDIGPAERAQVLVPTANAHLMLDVNPEEHIGQSLTDVRPPARTRRGR